MISAKDALNRLIDGNELFYDEMVDLMRQIMRGELTPAQIAAILIGLNQLVVSQTEYWPLTLGLILLLILFVFPSGVAGAVAAILTRLSGRRNA